MTLPFHSKRQRGRGRGHEEIPDRALNCEEDWYECEFNNCQFECRREGGCVQRGGPSMLSASYPPHMDPVMDKSLWRIPGRVCFERVAHENLFAYRHRAPQIGQLCTFTTRTHNFFCSQKALQRIIKMTVRIGSRHKRMKRGQIYHFKRSLIMFFSSSWGCRYF